MKRQFNACQTPRNMYPSIFNSFRVIRTASAKNSRFRVLQPTFLSNYFDLLFLLETPCDYHLIFPYGWKESWMIAKHLAACTHLSATGSQLFEPQVQKISYFHVPQPTFLFSSRDAPATTTLYFPSMKRELDGCQTSRSMYLSIFNSFRVIRCLSQCVSLKMTIFIIFFCFLEQAPLW